MSNKLFPSSSSFKFIFLQVTHVDLHCNDVIMGAIASKITSLTIVYSTVYSDADQRKNQSSASLAFVRRMSTVNSPHKWLVTRKMFPFDDVIMEYWHFHRQGPVHKNAFVYTLNVTVLAPDYWSVLCFMTTSVPWITNKGTRTYTLDNFIDNISLQYSFLPNEPNIV